MTSHSDLARLLASGGDGRLDIDDQGLNRYGCRFEPEPNTLQLGSCTASTLSELSFRAAGDAHRLVSDRPDLIESLYDDVRRRLVASLAADVSQRPGVLLMPSGTDAEYIPLLLALTGGRNVTNIVVAPTEVGSGSLAAAGLRHFDEITPDGGHVESGALVDAALAERVSPVTIRVRDDDGDPLPPEAIDENVESVVDRAVEDGHAVLIHVVAHSKTGVHAPSLECVRGAELRHRDRIHVVVDAAQGRVSRRGLAEALDAGWTVMVTGSKFFGGPPFSGAVLIPHRAVARMEQMACPPGLKPYFSSFQAPSDWGPWRASTERRADLGVLLRWVAAIAEIEAYYDLDSGTRFRILQSFERAAVAALGSTERIELEDASPSILDNEAARLLQSKHTVFSFSLHDRNGDRLGADDLRRVQHSLRTGAHRPADETGRRPSLVQTGQPVIVAPDGRALLRIALGAPLLRSYADHPPGEVDQLIEADLRFVATWLGEAA